MYLHYKTTTNNNRPTTSRSAPGLNAPGRNTMGLNDNVMGENMATADSLDGQHSHTKLYGIKVCRDPALYKVYHYNYCRMWKIVLNIRYFFALLTCRNSDADFQIVLWIFWGAF